MVGEWEMITFWKVDVADVDKKADDDGMNGWVSN